MKFDQGIQWSTSIVQRTTILHWSNQSNNCESVPSIGGFSCSKRMECSSHRQMVTTVGFSLPKVKTLSTWAQRHWWARKTVGKHSARLPLLRVTRDVCHDFYLSSFQCNQRQGVGHDIFGKNLRRDHCLTVSGIVSTSEVNNGEHCQQITFASDGERFAFPANYPNNRARKCNRSLNDTGQRRRRRRRGEKIVFSTLSWITFESIM